MDLFVFGTLLDQDVRRLVCGREPGTPKPACLRGFRRVHMVGRDYPMLVKRPAGRVEGLLLRAIDDDSLHRLTLYEGAEYDLVAATVTDAAGLACPAHIFWCPSSALADPRDWTLERWQMRHKRAFLVKLAHFMALALDGRQAKNSAAMVARSSVAASSNW